MKEIEFTDMDIEKLIVIQSVIDGKKTGKQASEKLNLSERQIWRLVAKVKNNGNASIKHGNCFNHKPRFITEDFKNKIIDLKLSNDYCDTNFTHFQELLEERENIKISYSSLYKILTEKGIKSKKKHKDKKTHRQRKRKDHMGELVQADGTPFDWFKDGHMYSIHGFIDDATGQVLGAYMCEHECLLGYLEVLRQMLTNYGIPQCLYPDKFSVFFPAKAQKLTIEEQLQGKTEPTTQFKRIIDVLGINMFPASTSQAKGRVERLWETFQDRLITEFKLAKVNTIEQANIFLKSYLKKYNKKFSVEPKSDKSYFIPVPSYLNLDLLLSIKLTRCIDASGSFTIKNKKFQILDNKIMPKTKVNIYMSQKIGIIAEHNNTKYKVICSDNLPNTYKNKTADKFFKEHSQELVTFALSLLTYDAKEKEPVLTSS
ncbi:MAG: ISNCY family transposase [Clostridia bacterium]|jgi:transposase